jgi:glycosyltransferase involved in cell wall biosynthesis
MDPYITVFTPTYNREILLKRLYQSLIEQKSKNFEWIIVDDESTDDTAKIVGEWIREEHTFPISYHRQNHGGKHRALNKGFRMARGIYFFIVDSDDYLTEDAIEKVERWGKVVENENDIAGVSGLRISNGQILGGIPDEMQKNGWIEAGNLERGKYGLWGDKAEAYKVQILRQHPFPEFAGEDFVTEAVCWDAIASEGYKIRWYGEAIYECEYLEDGLTRTEANGIKGHINNYKGFCYYVSQCMRVKKIWDWTGNLHRYNRVARMLHKKWRMRAKDLGISYGSYIFRMCIVFPYVYGIKMLKKVWIHIRCDIKRN